jgi:hypothetical protein
VDDIELGVGFDETAGRRADSRSHVGDEKSTIGLSADLVGDGREKSAVGLFELRLVRIAGVEVVRGIL